MSILNNSNTYDELELFSLLTNNDSKNIYEHVTEIENELLFYDTICEKYTILQYKNYDIIIDKSNLYINITRLCTNMNKKFSVWKQTVIGNQQITNTISHEGIERQNLFIRVYRSKKSMEYYGTFAHPKLIYYITKWISTSYCNIILTMLFCYYKNINYDTTVEPYCYYNNIPHIPHFLPFVVLNKYSIDKINIIFTAIQEKNNTYYFLKDKHSSILKFYELKYSYSSTIDCSICLETVYKKSLNDQYFGILSVCKHIFCFNCINIWKNTKNTCPICRKVFSIVIKSRFLHI
ncbi:RING finger protein [Hypsugopox virus]|nr:RING finger protein [Hypsugopox virus]